MNTVELKTTTVFHIEECCVCGVQFGMTESLQRYFRKYGKDVTFYCTNGHPQAYVKSTVAELEETKRALDVEKKRAEYLKESMDIYAAKVRELERTPAKRNKQECPHCKKKYKGLTLHIKMKHPEVEDEPK